LAGGVQIELCDARRLQPLGCLVRARDSPFEPYFPGFQRLDERGYGGSRSDAEQHAILDVGHRRFRRAPLLLRG
jgi:hypothetical protein